MDVDGQAIRQRRAHGRADADAARWIGNGRHRQVRTAEGRLARARGRRALRPGIPEDAPGCPDRARRCRRSRRPHGNRFHGHFRRRRHDRRRANDDRRRGPRQEGRTQHRRLAARRSTYSKAPKHPTSSLSRRSTCPSSSMRTDASNCRRLRRSGMDSTRWSPVSRETEARYEASRCLSCGNCFECDNCYASCPEQAIVKLGKGRFYRYDYDLCTGCAVCFEQCPCHAIEMVARSLPAAATGRVAPLPMPGKFKPSAT